jgi:menaquinone-dependent protoporphyrinogen oxidase
MKGIIIYESLHGSTEKCAKKLMEFFPGELKAVRLNEPGVINLDDYDTVVIGGSIHMGVIQMRIENFLLKNHDKLKEKNLGLYLCCMEEGETAKMQFEKAYHSELRYKASALGLFGGEFNWKKMNFFQRTIVKKLKGVTGQVSRINEEEIRKFAKELGKN